MKRSQHGFTIVEVLIVIALITILAVIGLISFSSLAASSRDQARQADARTWAESFENYKARNLVWPVVPTGVGVAGSKTICLGVFTNNKCGQFNSSTASKFYNASGTDYTTVRTSLTTVGKLHKNAAPTINGNTASNALAGPIVYIWRTTNVNPITIYAQFIFFTEGSCPSGSSNINSASYVSGLLVGQSNVNACAIAKDMTYSPTPA